MAQIEVTSFLKNKFVYGCWTALKIGLQATWLVSWRIGLCVNAVGLFLQFKKYIVKRENWYFSAFFVAPLPAILPSDCSSAPVSYKNYLKHEKDPTNQRTFFQNLSSGEKRDFCRWFAQNSPAEVGEFLKFDLEHKILDDSLYLELLDTITLKNEDPFLCCYSIAHLANWRDSDKKYTITRVYQVWKTLLYTLSMSTPSKKNPEEPTSNLVLTEKHLPALQQIFPYLANNDRAHLERCCKLFYRVVHDQRHVPTIQSAVGDKLVWLLSFKRTLVDEFSIGQIEALLKAAKRKGILEEAVMLLHPPSKDIAIWKRAGEICLSIGISSLSSFLMTGYTIYIAWQQEKISQKNRAFQQYYSEFYFSLTVGPVLDPLAIWILEQGLSEDKSLVCHTYVESLSAWDRHKRFFLLMNYYLDQSPHDFQTYFLAHFQELMKKKATQFDEQSVKKSWHESAPHLAWQDYLCTQLSLFIPYDQTLFFSIVAKLKKLKDPPTFSLFLNFFASFCFPIDS